MGKNVKCVNCAFSKPFLKKKTLESIYLSQSSKGIKCTVGFRILEDGSPGSQCNGKFFEPK